MEEEEEEVVSMGSVLFFSKDIIYSTIQFYLKWNLPFCFLGFYSDSNHIYNVWLGTLNGRWIRWASSCRNIGDWYYK